MQIQPPKKSADATSSQGHAGVSRSVIEINGIPVLGDGLATRKNDVADISSPLVGGLWARISRNLRAVSTGPAYRDQTMRVPGDRCFLTQCVGHRDREQASPSRFQSVVSRDLSCWRPTIHHVVLQASLYDCPNAADPESRRSTCAHRALSPGGE